MADETNPDGDGHSARDSARECALLPEPKWVTNGNGGKTEARPVPGFPGYFVTEDGRVYSNVQTRGTWLKRLEPRPDGDGYLYVEVSGFPRRKNVRVHRMVALAFLGDPPPDKPEVRHLDGEPGHNHRRNLAWGTHAQNMADRAAHGRNPKGTRNGRAKVGPVDVAEIRLLLALGIGSIVLARTYELTAATIYDIKRGKLWPDVHPAVMVRPERIAAARQHALANGPGISNVRRRTMSAALDTLCGLKPAGVW